jgi:chemotaxis protein MotB
VETVLTPYGLRVMLHDTDRQGMFVRGSAVPTDRFLALLRRMGPLFRAMDNQMLVLGHTDSLQYAGSETSGFSNWTLSSNRAMSARAQLIIGGMNPKAVLQVVGMADRSPLDTAHPDAGINRRIELLILTRSQARTIAAMYGVPGHKEALTEDIYTALPDASALQQLRDQLLPARASKAPATAQPAQ